MLALAATPDNITAGEVALLPEYCPLTQTFSRDDPRNGSVDSPARRLFVQLGPSYMALHHYCWGLIHINRSKQAGLSQYSRRAMFGFALNEYKYVLENSAPDFVLLPEVYLRVGEAHAEMQAYGAALDAFTRSRTLNPDYWPPYVRWADVLARLGKRPEALAHLEEGLRAMPTERGLIEAYERLGGNFARFAKSPRAVPTTPPRIPESAASAASAPTAAASAAGALQ